ETGRIRASDPPGRADRRHGPGAGWFRAADHGHVMTAPKVRPGILDIEPYVGGKSTLAGHAKVIKLASNESALGPSPRAVEALRKAAETMHRYPDGGSIDLRGAIAKRFGLDVARVVCGTGSDG